MLGGWKAHLSESIEQCIKTRAATGILVQPGDRNHTATYTGQVKYKQLLNYDKIVTMSENFVECTRAEGIHPRKETLGRRLSSQC